MKELYHSTITILFAFLLQIAGLSFVTAYDPYIKEKDRSFLQASIVLTVLLVAQNVLDYRLPVATENTFWFTLVSFVGYVLRPVILCGSKKRKKPDRKPLPAAISGC